MKSAAHKAVDCRLKAEGQRRESFSGYSLQPTAYSLRSSTRGVTLIELVVFIVIVALVMIAMVQAFSRTSNGMATGKMLTAATQAGQQRMEAIVAQIRFLRSTVGYTGITAANFDPCSAGWSNQACSSGSSTVTSNANFASNVCGPGTANNCFEVTVTATDANSALSSPLVLTYQVWNY